MKSVSFVRAAVLALCFTCALPGISFAAPQLSGAVQLNKIAAVVNGEIITLHELRGVVGPELMRRGIQPGAPGSEGAVNDLMDQTMARMINNILLRQEAERLQITVSDTDVDNELNMVIQRNQTTREAFEASLAAQGSSLDRVREEIKNSILSQRIVSIMIARKVVVTQEEVARYYEAHSAEFMADRSLDLSLIVFPATADATAIASRIREGKISFEEAAREYSIGPQPEAGGKLGFVSWKDLIPPVQAAATGLQDGGTSALFAIESYKALVRVHSATSGRQMTLEEATPEIENLLRAPLLQARFEEYTQQLRNKAVVDIRI